MKMKQTILTTAFALLVLSAGYSFAEEAASSANAVQIITSGHNYEEMDKMPQALVQLCLQEECAAQKAVLDKFASSFASVAFVQMSTSDNVDFAKRIKLEQQASAEAEHNIVVQYWRAFLRYMGWGGELKVVQFPIYIFKGNELNVAPAVATDEQLKQFIELNASYAKEEG